MMRKLAVTVFAISLTALGCGSDSGTPAKNDAGDAAKAPSAEVGVTPDVGGAKDVAASETTTPIDGAKPDVPTTEAAQVVEAGQVGEAGQNLDGKRDSSAPLDVTPRFDGGAVDTNQDAAQPDANVGEAGAVDTGTGEAGAVDTGVTG
jgi:hypothetical protein